MNIRLVTMILIAIPALPQTTVIMKAMGLPYAHRASPRTSGSLPPLERYQATGV